MSWVRDHKKSHSSTGSGGCGFRVQRTFRNRLIAVEAAGSRPFLRLVAEYDHRLAADVQIRVVVVTKAWRRNSIAGKDQRSVLHRSRCDCRGFVRWSRQRVVRRAERQRHGAITAHHLERVARADGDAGIELEGLIPAVCRGGRQTRGTELTANVVGRPFELRRAVRPSLHLV